MEIKGLNPTPISENRSRFVLIALLAIMVLFLLVVLYFMKQKNLGEVNISQENPAKKQYAPSLEELTRLTTAPENLNIKPSPEMVMASSSSEESVHVKVDKNLIDALTAPSKN